MNRPFKSAFALVFASFAVAAGAATLEPGKPTTGTITGDGVAAFSIEAKAGDLLRITADQTKGDVALRAVDPAKQFVRESNKRAPDADVLEVVAESTGTFSIEVRRGDKSAATTEYAVTAEELRPATATEKSRIIAETRLDAGDRLINEGNKDSLQKSLPLFEEAARLAEQSQNKLLQGRALDSIGWFYDRSGDYRKAITYYKQALPVRRESGDRKGEALTLQGIGLSHLILGEIDEALATNNQVLALAREIKDRKREGSVLHNIGGIYWSTDEMQKALEQYAAALAIWRELGDKPSEASTLNNTGDVYRRLGDNDRALTYFNQALEIRRSLGNKRGEAHSMHTIGLTYLALDQPKKALENFTRALELRRETGDRQGEAFSLGGSAAARQALGEFDKALELQQQSVAIWEKNGEPRPLGEAYQSLGFISVDMKQNDRAIELFDKALPFSRTARDRTYEARSLYGLAKAKRNLNRLTEARADIEKALEILESLRGRLQTDELRASYLGTIQDFYDFYVDLLMRIEESDPKSGTAAMALEVSERARARSLIDALSAGAVDIHEGVDRELLRKESELRVLIAQKERQRTKIASSRQAAELEKIERELTDLTNRHGLLLAEIRRQSPRYASLTQPKTLTASELRGLLQDDAALVEFWLGSERSFVWVVTAIDVSSFVLPPRKEIETIARDTYSALVARNKEVAGETAEARRARIESAESAYGELSRKLVQTILAPAAARLKAARLLIVPDGALHYLPFAALPAPGASTSEMLISKHEVVALPSASVLPLLSQTGRAKPTKIAAVFADPVFDTEDPRVKAEARNRVDQPVQVAELRRSLGESGLGTLDRLRFSRREAEAIAALIPEGEKFAALDFSASREAAVDASLREYAIVHFATHGVLDSKYPQLSGLVLSLVDADGKSKDGFLRLQDIYNLSLSADLVVLSACQTALGKELKGEGLVGLTRGFMYAGAQRVVASLWKVDDRATAELMERFYTNLLQKKQKPATALRNAQLSMMGEKRWRSPYYWAAFSLQGD